MEINYGIVIKMLNQAFLVQSKTELIAYFKDTIAESIKVANDLEDYDFLSVFAEATTKFDNYVIAFDTRLHSFERPIVLEIGRNLTLMDMAHLFYKCRNRIDITEFYKCIEDEANYQSMDPNSLMAQFDLNIAAIINEIRESERKIQRNDPCPCNSGKKYKHCHGVNG